MVGSIMNTVSQVTDGIKGSTGLDLKSILAGALGTKLLSKNDEKEVKVIEIEKVPVSTDIPEKVDNPKVKNVIPDKSSSKEEKTDNTSEKKE